VRCPQIYPFDATFDTPDDVPEAIKTNKRYAGLAGYTISEVGGGPWPASAIYPSKLTSLAPTGVRWRAAGQVAEQVKADYGKIDILVHSLANGPEVTKPLLETSRNVGPRRPRALGTPGACGSGLM
jgi:enoyl-[acyl-carrier protein] reductase I